MLVKPFSSIPDIDINLTTEDIRTLSDINRYAPYLYDYNPVPNKFDLFSTKLERGPLTEYLMALRPFFPSNGENLFDLGTRILGNKSKLNNGTPSNDIWTPILKERNRMRWLFNGRLGMHVEWVSESLFDQLPLGDSVEHRYLGCHRVSIPDHLLGSSLVSMTPMEFFRRYVMARQYHLDIKDRAIFDYLIGPDQRTDAHKLSSILGTHILHMNAAISLLHRWSSSLLSSFHGEAFVPYAILPDEKVVKSTNFYGTLARGVSDEILLFEGSTGRRLEGMKAILQQEDEEETLYWNHGIWLPHEHRTTSSICALIILEGDINDLKDLTPEHWLSARFDFDVWVQMHGLSILPGPKKTLAKIHIADATGILDDSQFQRSSGTMSYSGLIFAPRVDYTTEKLIP